MEAARSRGSKQWRQQEVKAARSRGTVKMNIHLILLLHCISIALYYCLGGKKGTYKKSIIKKNQCKGHKL